MSDPLYRELSEKAQRVGPMYQDSISEKDFQSRKKGLLDRLRRYASNDTPKKVQCMNGRMVSRILYEDAVKIVEAPIYERRSLMTLAIRSTNKDLRLDPFQGFHVIASVSGDYANVPFLRKPNDRNLVRVYCPEAGRHYLSAGVNARNAEGVLYRVGRCAHCGLNHEIVNEGLSAAKEKLKTIWSTPKGHKQRLIGIELEFATPKIDDEIVQKYREGCCDIVRPDGSPCCPGIGEEKTRVLKVPRPKAIYRDIDIPGVHIKTDGSVKPCHADAAEATLLAGERGFDRLRKLCQEIKKRGGIVNKTTGLHVHLDAREDDQPKAMLRANKLYDALEVIKDLVPETRLTKQPEQDRHYCKLEPPAFDTDHYKAINLSAYAKYKTIEVRLAAGSLNPGKIWKWASLLYEISNLKRRITDWDEFLDSKIPLHLKMWAIDRADELRPNAKLRQERTDAVLPGLEQFLIDVTAPKDDSE